MNHKNNPLTLKERQESAREYDKSEGRQKYSSQRIKNSGVNFAKVFEKSLELAKNNPQLF